LTEEEKKILCELPVGVVVINTIRRIIFSNPAAERLLGAARVREGESCHRCIWRNNEPCIECPLEVDGINPLVRELEIPHQERFLEIHAQLRDNGDVITTIKDVSLRKHFQKEHDNAILTDPASGLFKSQFIREDLQREIHRAERTAGGVSLILVRVPELDAMDIKAIPKIIAQILRSIGEVTESETQTHNRAYRFGHDTFAIILPEQDLAGALRNAKKMLERAKELGIDGIKIGVTAIGKIRTADSLIHSAQHALHKAGHSKDPIATA